MAISGDSAIVGAHQDNTAAGAAYEFERNQGGPNNWGEVQKLTASDATVAFDNFGKSVGISGNTAIVGALFQDEAGGDAGAAYVFEAPKPPTPTTTATATPAHAHRHAASARRRHRARPGPGRISAGARDGGLVWQQRWPAGRRRRRRRDRRGRG